MSTLSLIPRPVDSHSPPEDVPAAPDTPDPRLLATLAEHCAVGICQLSMPDGRTLYMNPAMRRLLELDEAEARQHPRYDEFLTPDARARMNAEMARRAQGLSGTYEVDLIGRRGGRRAVLVSGVPDVAPDGTLRSVVATFTDITARRHTEHALRESETRLRLLAEQVPAILWTADAQLRFTSSMGAGRSASGTDSAQFLGKSILAVGETPDWTKSPAVQAHRRALAGESTDYEQKWRAHWYRCRTEPLRDADGAITGVIGIALDITERKKAEDELRDTRDWLEYRVEERTEELKRANEALRRQIAERKDVEEDLRQSQARYASILNSQQTLIARSDMHGRITYVNAAHQRTFGSQVGDNVFVRVHPDDVAPTERAMATLTQPPYTCTLEQRCEVRGQWRTIQWQVGVIRDRTGQVVEYQGVGFDITDRRRAEELLRESERRAKESAEDARDSADQAQQALEEARQVAEFNRRLAQEVDHRVRNNLAGLMSLVSAMKSNATSLDARAFASAIEGRLLAMIHVNRLLAETNWKAVDLRVLVTSLLDAVKQLGCHPIAVKVDGPPVLVSPRQTSPLSMILVEWFTNSCKYGAHSTATGRLMVVWAIDRSVAPPRLRLHWTETGGPPVRRPVKPSLGTELVEGFATLELRGKLDLRFPEEGADHVLEFPLE